MTSQSAYRQIVLTQLRVGEASPQGTRYMDLKFFLEDLFGKPVDLVTKRSLKPQIAASILEEAILVWRRCANDAT